MQLGLAVGDVRGPATVDAIVDQVRVAADAGFATAWSSQAVGWDALTVVAVAGAAVADIAVGTAVVPVPPLLRGDSVDHCGETLTAAGAVTVPGGVPAPSVLVAAMGPRMVRVAGELADGTATWMTGPKALGEHIVPAITKAAADAGRPAPRVVAGLPVCVTGTANDVRARIAEQFALAARVPEYRATLDREGAAGPQDVAIVGTETEVARALTRFRDAGVTEFMAAPYGTADEQNRTVDLLAELAR